jgi:outer membrane protein assembly factor BamB
VLTAALLAVGALVLSSCDWPQFRGGPEHTGYASTETKIGVGNVGTLVEKWTATTGGIVHSSPAVVNGVVYVGSEDGKLYAFNATGGALLWTATTGGPVDSSPAVVNNVVYVGSNDGKLYAFDATGTAGCAGTPKTCAPLWTAQTGGPVGSSPTVANGVVYVASEDHSLYAFDAAGNNCSGTPKTCAPLWTGATGGTIPIDSSPAVANGVVYIGAAAGASLGQLGGVPISALEAFDATGTGCSGTPKTCARLWTSSGSVSQVNSSPMVANGLVFFGSSTTHALTLDGYTAAGTTGCSGAPKTCSPVWTSAGIVGNGPWNSSPAAANGAVYVGGTQDCPFCTPDHNLYAFSATGAQLWRAATGGQVLSSPAVANGVVYVGSDDHNLYAFNAASGVKLWSSTTGDSIDSSPTVANGIVYVGSNDGKLYAFGLP